jgi:hypothetical protein
MTRPHREHPQPADFKLSGQQGDTAPKQHEASAASAWSVIETQPAIEVVELDEYASESDLALAERLLAELLVRSWRESRKNPGEDDITGATVGI